MLENRTIEISTPLDPDELLFYRLEGHEELGRLYEFVIDLLSEQGDVDFTSVIGQPMSVRAAAHEGETRYLTGIVTRFSDVGSLGRYSRYSATLRPTLWLLTQKQDCRIFQKKSAVEIIKDVLREHGVTFKEADLASHYRTRDYCVQYRESDFNFISRLMEEEGIYYFFEHQEGKETLVLTDSVGAHGTMTGYKEVPFFPRQEHGDRRERDHIDTWMASMQIEPGACFLQDFDFKRPKANLQVKLVARHDLARSELVIYDYPGVYTETEDGENYVRVRLEELYARQARVRGEGDVRGLIPGYLFTLTEFPRADQNIEYLVVSARYELESAPPESASENKEDVFRTVFTAIDSQRPYRPARTTPKPLIRGPQTAMVVGKSNEEIWTDEHARVKLQFHWDRLGKADEASSCWVRVAQLWAGNAWGGIHVPRIGQEVIVEFLEGDPDRPLVTGRLYNGDNKPPYGLPANQTQSGIKSRSSKGGTPDNFNEIRFEDKKGEEQLFVQAEKDKTVNVKNNSSTSVGNDASLSVGHDRSATVTNNDSLTVKRGTRTVTVKGDTSLTVQAGKNAISVTGGDYILDAASDNIKATAAQGVIIHGKAAGVSVTGNAKGVAIAGDGKGVGIEGKGGDGVGIKGTPNVNATGDAAANIGAPTIGVKGKDVTVEGSASVSIGTAKITIKGGPIKIEGGEVSVSGSTVKIKGSSVDINGSGGVKIAGATIKLN